jgi:hypothetical protein
MPPDPFECPPEPDTDNPPASSPVCPAERVWGDGARVSIPVSGADVLLSVTPDELSIAWGVVDVFSTGLFVADRALAADDFGTPIELTDAVLAASDQLALSPDALRLVAVVGGRLLEASRSARGDAFDAPGEGSFTLLNADAESEGTSLADPVISPDDLSLYYSVVGGSDDTLHVSTRTGSGAWPVGRSVAECELRAHSGQGRIPLAISSDGLSLFYLDSPRGITRVAERPALDWPFLEFADLPGRSSARPNEACDRLYYAGMGMLQFEVLVAEAE